MKVVILRHAARSAHESGDCSLSAFGHLQAEALARSLAPQGDLPPPTRLICSPKKRTRQTLTPLAHAAQLEIVTDGRLDERHNHESGREFETRINSLLEELSRPRMALKAGEREPCVYLCTHLDWLNSASALIPSDASPDQLDRHWGNCEYLVFRLNDGLWECIQGGMVSTSRS